MQVPSVKKETKMSEGIKALVGRKMTKTVKFMGDDVKIFKLSVQQVLAIQEKAKEIETNDAAGLEVLKLVISAGVEGGGELTDEDFQDFSMDELSKLSAEVMKFSGIGTEAGK
jgi:hypothetical protein